MNKSLISIVFVVLLFATIFVYSSFGFMVLGANAFMAFNEDESLCGLFHPGHEPKVYKLPDGWTAHNLMSIASRTSSEFNITVKGKECVVQNYSYRSTYDDMFKQCCEEFGYTYIEGNVGKRPFFNYISAYFISIQGFITIIIILIAVFVALVIKKD